MDFITKISQAFEHGGMWMYVILVIQLFSVAIMIERSIVLFGRKKLNQTALALGFEDDIRRGEIDAVINKANNLSTTEPVAKAILAGAKSAKFFGGKEEIQAKMDEVLLHENALLDRRTGFLSMLGNVATLVGLLGTITGMIKSFAAVSYASPTEKAALLAAGISEAMNATAYGLIAAIPALVAYAILMNRANLVSEDLNQGALKVFNWLSYNYESVGFKSMKKTGKNSNNEINA
ncbi:MAG: MotA/TolQ/ExbB proton channel family protein [Moraxellaceae bacterium]|nr:MotA/TolQ/ExbB proton channel family protein [Pseudobdellovibrionaceae bacterium]